MKPNYLKNVSLLQLTARLVVGAALVTSFFAPLVSLHAATSAARGSMSCCAGKSSGHCSSGLHVRRAKPKPETMCGPKAQLASDERTIVAEQEEDFGNTEPASETPISSSKPSVSSVVGKCTSDCCTSSLGSMSRPRPREVNRASSLRLKLPASNAVLVSHQPDPLTTPGPAQEASVPRGPPVSSC